MALCENKTQAQTKTPFFLSFVGRIFFSSQSALKQSMIFIQHSKLNQPKYTPRAFSTSVFQHSKLNYPRKDSKSVLTKHAHRAAWLPKLLSPLLRSLANSMTPSGTAAVPVRQSPAFIVGRLYVSYNFGHTVFYLH